MKLRFVLTLAFSVLALPAMAEEEDGLSLIERGAQLLMDGILKEMEPALDELADLGPTLRDFAEEMGPALAELMAEIKDWSIYHPPEILPNGDIIIRRRTPEEMPPDSDEIEI